MHRHQAPKIEFLDLNFIVKTAFFFTGKENKNKRISGESPQPQECKRHKPLIWKPTAVEKTHTHAMDCVTCYKTAICWQGEWTAHAGRKFCQWEQRQSKRLYVSLGLKSSLSEGPVPAPPFSRNRNCGLIISLPSEWKGPKSRCKCVGRRYVKRQTWVGVEIHGAQRKMGPLLSWSCPCWPPAPHCHLFICSSSADLSPSASAKSRSRRCPSCSAPPSLASRSPTPHVTVFFVLKLHFCPVKDGPAPHTVRPHTSA